MITLSGSAFVLLAGPIPPGLRQLAVLELLDLSLNNLEGELNNVPYSQRLFGAAVSYRVLQSEPYGHYTLRCFGARIGCHPAVFSNPRLTCVFSCTTVALHLNVYGIPLYRQS